MEIEIVKKLAAIRSTLNGVSVSGSDNLNRLLGCIQTIDQMIEDAKPKEEE